MPFGIGLLYMTIIRAFDIDRIFLHNRNQWLAVKRWIFDRLTLRGRFVSAILTTVNFDKSQDARLFLLCCFEGLLCLDSFKGLIRRSGFENQSKFSIAFNRVRTQRYFILSGTFFIQGMKTILTNCRFFPVQSMKKADYWWIANYWGLDRVF